MPSSEKSGINEVFYLGKMGTYEGDHAGVCAGARPKKDSRKEAQEENSREEVQKA